MKDNRSPFAKARDDWMECPEGKKCRFGVADGQDLENRLHLAFMAGWVAGSEHAEDAILDAMFKLVKKASR